MNIVKIPGVYTPEAGNFFVDSIAKYVRDNNYPKWRTQFCDICTNDGCAFNYIISNDDEYSDLFEEVAEHHPEEYDKSSGVLYKVLYRDFEMLIDGHYYWATL